MAGEDGDLVRAGGGVSSMVNVEDVKCWGEARVIYLGGGWCEMEGGLLDCDGQGCLGNEQTKILVGTAKVSVGALELLRTLRDAALKV